MPSHVGGAVGVALGRACKQPGADAPACAACAGRLSRPQVSARLIRQADSRRLIVYLYQLFDKKSPSSSVIAGTWKRESLDNPGSEELVAVDLVFLLGELDGLAGTPFAEEMGRWGPAGGAAACPPKDAALVLAAALALPHRHAELGGCLAGRTARAVTVARLGLAWRPC